VSDPQPSDEVLGYYALGGEKDPLEQAGQASAARTAGRLASARVSDARRLDLADASADAVLMLGPLYHLADGQHRNETGVVDFFTTAFFHQLGELGVEVREAGFALLGLFAVEGPGAFVPDFRARWEDSKARDRLLDLVRRVEREPALLGVSPHLLAVGRRR
jgi:hypothetical protein